MRLILVRARRTLRDGDRRWGASGFETGKLARRMLRNGHAGSLEGRA